MNTHFCKVGNIRPAKPNTNKKSQLVTLVVTLLFAFISNAQVDGWNPELESEAKEALNTILEKTPKLESFKNKAYGYAVFPKITKGAAGIGGAAGNGIVYKDHSVVGKAHLKQATIGFQVGGQQYVEVIFFESQEAFKRFTNGKLKFDAQASAVALKEGVSIDAAYQDNVAVFTLTNGGLMYEASIGGQHFKYKPKEGILENEEFDSFVVDQLAKWKVPGAAIGIVKDGQIVYAKGFGYRNVEEKLKSDENTLFAIGSLTKSMTATTIGILVDKEEISWDSKLVELLPDFKLKDEFATKHINFVDLLCHRSGLPNHNFMWYVTDFPRKEIIYRLRYLEPSEDFRTTFQYNPNMYTLAGYAVGQITGNSWEEFTVQNIFEPLGMFRSNFTYMDMIKDSNHSLPYIEKNGLVIKTAFHPSQHLSAPAGSVNSSVREMANWMIMNLNHGEYNNRKIISSESLSYIQSPHITFPSTSPERGIGPEGPVHSFTMYGLGWDISTYYDQIVLKHLGGIDGFSSALVLYPRINAGVVVLTNNQMGGGQFCDVVVNRVATNLLNKKKFDLSGWISKEIESQKSNKKYDSLEKAISMTRDINEYTGTYADEGYGDISITFQNDRLWLQYYRYDVELNYLGDDVFTTVNGIINRKVKFHINEFGKVNSLAIQWERAVDPIVFTKKLNKK